MFFQVLWPSLISTLALSVANMADALAVGNRMGESGLAAIGIVTPLYMIYNVLGLAFATGGSVTHSRLTAEGRDEEAVAHFKRMCLWLFGLSLVIAILGNLLLDVILKLLGAGLDNPVLHRLCGEYARPLLYAAPVMLFNLVLYNYVRCDNGARIATIGFTVGCVADVGFNILFVLVLGWGVKGSAWATVIAQTISVVIMSLHFRGKTGVLNIAAMKHAVSGADTDYLVGRSVRLGLTTSSGYVFQFLFLVLGNRLLLLAGQRGLINGEDYVAVFDVVMNISYVAYGVCQAFSDTMQPLASTFSAEHDADDLRYLIHIAMGYGLSVGTAVAVLIGLFAGDVSGLFGIRGADTLALSVRAIRIFCLSTPFAGATIILTGYYQSTDKELLASLATTFRTLAMLLPVTFLTGWFFPLEFWWLFFISEFCSLAALLIAVFLTRKKYAARAALPVFSAFMDQSDYDLAQVLAGVEEFCDRQEIPIKTATLLQLAVEELTVVTIEKAFTGGKDEYIQLTIAGEENGDYVLHIRNSAPQFNPFDMRMDRINAQLQEDVMDSMGVMMVKKKAKDLHYRNFQGFNVMTVRL